MAKRFYVNITDHDGIEIIDSYDDGIWTGFSNTPDNLTKATVECEALNNVIEQERANLQALLAERDSKIQELEATHERLLLDGSDTPTAPDYFTVPEVKYADATWVSEGEVTEPIDNAVLDELESTTGLVFCKRCNGKYTAKQGHEYCHKCLKAGSDIQSEAVEPLDSERFVVKAKQTTDGKTYYDVLDTKDSWSIVNWFWDEDIANFQASQYNENERHASVDDNESESA